MTSMPLQVAIVGAGNVGLALARMLAATGDYNVRVGDCTEEARAGAAAHGIEARHVDASSASQLAAFLNGADVAVAAVPDRLVPRVMAAARNAGCHYLDFSMPDGASVDAGPRCFRRGCGVSPGLTDLIVAGLAAESEEAIDLELAVGAIPRRRTNRLGYSLIWNLDGLYAEYTSPCEAIENFEVVSLPPLSRLSAISLAGTDYEAFCTAGVIGSMRSLADTNIRSLVCRTIRYPGHLDYMLLLLDDLGLRQRPDMLRTLLRNGLDEAERDIVLLHASSRRAGDDTTRAITIRIEDSPELGNALAVGSAAHAAFLVDRIAAGTVSSFPSTPDTLAALIESRFAKGIISLHRA